MQYEEIPFNHYLKDGEETLIRYEESCDWLESLGFNYKASRYNQYKDSIDNLSNVLEGSPSDSDLEKSFHAYLNAYAEAIDLIRVKSAMDGADFDSFKDRLKKVVSGSAFRNSSMKDQSRNFLFELNIAARFISGGYEVDLNHKADLVTFVGDTKLYVECKRIRSINKVSSNIKKANSQILNRLKNDKSSKSRGMIAINVNDILNPDNDMVVTESVEDLHRLNSEHLNQFVEFHEDKLKPKESKKTIGVFCEYINQAMVNEKDEIKACNCRGGKLYQYREGGINEKLVREIAQNIANQQPWN
ncbi:hypothetical protein NO559_16295 [Dasania sp. GY-MA-18]|uniref:Uncharacterized protein n=1 Tax=Dasania phycosphaerae TaxID=2950436 RepID=A0A9J6RSD0_9GAMM|nr:MULTISPECIES: hypothetical protein [Dasania]MCR8924336.1 hypothetical protein [Dasania sp. GY-MA-18]MCZ0866989.1 hypothetical protein [Dasania phycosphaerae]MCZ0870493.1 hypothetical protein [Dasania phycosphaerae]